jgi:anionic cell wall polymer biosynthesis LytR-Cps2A-Psr (LCP) family protein
MKKYFFISLIIIAFSGFLIWFGRLQWENYVEIKASRARDQEIDRIIREHHERISANAAGDDLFQGKHSINILLIGLDQRAGQGPGHCDAIQMITIDRNKQSVAITAVPRGTYSPLPPGTGKLPSDYYVSNSCALGGLDYGIAQIEKILGVKADYLVTVGFSEALGVLRNLKLPTTETLQWLRQRHVYAIGEPQRAHDHSTFLKYLLLKYLPTKDSSGDKILHYIIYETVHTDLTFDEAEALVAELTKMDLVDHPDRVRLAMQPAFLVQDIPYVPEDLTKYLDKTLGNLDKILTKDDYAAVTLEETQAKLLLVIDEKKTDVNFNNWAFENKIWLQIEDHDKRMATQHDLLVKYIDQLVSPENKQSFVLDYIVEMENRNEDYWLEEGRKLLSAQMP